MPEISVIIPVHNMETYLPACLDGVLAQTFKDIEIICIDDGSTDSSYAILEVYSKKDSRVTATRLENNIGPGPARNMGIEKASGRYCIFCDADDIYPQRALETLYEGAEAAGAPVSGGNIVIMDHTMSRILGTAGSVACTQFFEKQVVRPQEFAPFRLPYYHPRYLFAVDFLKKNGIRYPALLRGQDPPFLAQVFCRAERAAVCPEVTYLYRGSQPGTKKLSGPGIFEDYVRHIPMTYSIYMEHKDERGACFFLAQAMDSLFRVRRWLAFSSGQRRLLLKRIMPLVDSAGSRLFELDYAPYPMDGRRIKAGIQLMKKGQYIYLAAKIAESIYSNFKAVSS